MGGKYIIMGEGGIFFQRCGNGRFVRNEKDISYLSSTKNLKCQIPHQIFSSHFTAKYSRLFALRSRECILNRFIPEFFRFGSKTDELSGENNKEKPRNLLVDD